MDSKWPFFIITFGLLFLLGIIISKLERTGVMKNWDKRRCQFPVMFAASFFKPKEDPRSSSEFASDNFQFCMKSYVDDFINIILSPFQSVFGQHANIAGTSLGMVNSLRNTASNMYNAFLSVLQPYFQRFTYATYEVSIIFQYLRLAFRRLNAMMISFVYTGITMFRGMINSIQFIIKVVLIICGIMLAIIIILIFVLFPFIPLIISVLGAIIVTILAISMYVGGSVDSVISMKNGFCFKGDTLVGVYRDNIYKQIPISDIQIGDILGNDCGKVSAIIQMSGKDVELYNINGIYVSGSHVILGEDGIWKLVENDNRAIKTQYTTDILYCLNTTSRKIPIIYPNTSNIQLFRDWEELSDNDTKGQSLWNYFIFKKLNGENTYNKWKNFISPSNDIGLFGIETPIKTPGGWKKIGELKISDIILDKFNNPQKVLGVIYGIVHGKKSENGNIWNNELIYFNNNTQQWEKINEQNIINTTNESDILYGKTLIVESGHFIAYNEQYNEICVRDFTDIGYDIIHLTYPLVADRLRLEQ